MRAENRLRQAKPGGGKVSPTSKPSSKWPKPLLAAVAVGIVVIAAGVSYRDKPAVSSPPDSLALMEKLLADKARPKEAPVAAQPEPVKSEHPPEVLGVDVKPASFYRGVDLVASAEANDPGNDLSGFRFRWFINDQPVENGDEAKLSGDAFKRGDRLALEIVALDAQGEGKAFRTADVVVPNGPPKIMARSPGASDAQRFETLIKAVDPDGDPISFALENAPAGMEINARTGLVSWPLNTKLAGAYSFRVVASDPEGLKSTQEYTLNLSVPPGKPGN